MRRRLALLGLALTLACTRAAPPAPTPRPIAKPALDEVPSPSAPLSGNSIYDLEMSLRDQRDARVGLDVFRGRPTLVAMFYASCPAACPRLIEDLQAIERGLPADARANLRVLMVSFDADRDTPARLAEVIAERHLDPARWRLAASEEPQARELAGVLGVKYRRLDGGVFYHTSVITVVDGDGRPLARVEGLGRSPAPILARLGHAPE